jgi:hypothetical protein
MIYAMRAPALETADLADKSNRPWECFMLVEALGRCHPVVLWNGDDVKAPD